MDKDKTFLKKAQFYLGKVNGALTFGGMVIAYITFIGVDVKDLDFSMMPEIWITALRWIGFIASSILIIYVVIKRQDRIDNRRRTEQQIQDDIQTNRQNSETHFAKTERLYLDNRTLLLKMYVRGIPPEEGKIFLNDYLEKQSLVEQADLIIDRETEEGNTILDLFMDGEEEPFSQVLISGKL